MLNWKRLALTVPLGLLLVGGAVRADTVPSGMSALYAAQRTVIQSHGYHEIFEPDAYRSDEGDVEHEGMTLNGGEYLFVGMCDCDDLDL